MSVKSEEVLKICHHQQKGLGINNCVGQINGCVQVVSKKFLKKVIGSKNNHLRYFMLSPQKGLWINCVSQLATRNYIKIILLKCVVLIDSIVYTIKLRRVRNKLCLSIKSKVN